MMYQRLSTITSFLCAQESPHQTPRELVTKILFSYVGLSVNLAKEMAFTKLYSQTSEFSIQRIELIKSHFVSLVSTNHFFQLPFHKLLVPQVLRASMLHIFTVCATPLQRPAPHRCRVRLFGYQDILLFKLCFYSADDGTSLLIRRRLPAKGRLGWNGGAGQQDPLITCGWGSLSSPRGWGTGSHASCSH